MTAKRNLTVLVLAAALAAPLAAAPVLAADPNGSTATLPPRAPDPGPSMVPLPSRTPSPTVGVNRLPDAPDGFAAEAEMDRMVDVLLGATDLAAPGGACPAMITCCNSAWVQGCNADYFQDVCEIYDGVYQTQVLSDGSINYECHYAN